MGVGVGAVPALSPLICRVPIRFLHSELLNTQYGSLYMPSTGALMLLTALHTCDQVRATEPPWGEGNPPLLAAVGLQRVLLAVLHVPSLQGVTEHPRQSLDPVFPPSPSPQVSAYGFITANYEQFSDHYYEVEKKPLVFYANHDMMLEAALWRSLHRAGIISLYQR